jgi:hypothetical protein
MYNAMCSLYLCGFHDNGEEAVGRAILGQYNLTGVWQTAKVIV